jgi:hypothetical protein
MAAEVLNIETQGTDPSGVWYAWVDCDDAGVVIFTFDQDFEPTTDEVTTTAQQWCDDWNANAANDDDDE